MKITGVNKHADFYPLLSDEELNVLIEDIRENGQNYPITVDKDGVLLDGRNRLRACEALGIEPEYVVYEGDDAGAFIRSSNERRHQPTGSRAMSTALSMAEDGLRVNGRWKYGSLNSEDLPNSSAWVKAIRQAGSVLDYAPELASAVINGQCALDDAYRQANEKRHEIEDIERRRIAAAEDEKKRETYATEYFQNHSTAKEWLDSKPAGVFATMREAHAAYMEADRKAREVEERRRREEERARREQQDRVKRYASWVETFVSVYSGMKNLKTLSYRDDVLAALNPMIRERFLIIEKELHSNEHE